MIDSYTATSVIVGFLVIFGVLLPILDKIPKIRDIVSFRWTVVVIYSALSIGVIIDFAHLDTSVRFSVVIGGIVLSAIFLIVRSIEKAALNDWHLPRTRASVKKGDIQAELSVHPKISGSIKSSSSSSDLELSDDDSSIEINEAVSRCLNDDSGVHYNKHLSLSSSNHVSSRSKK